MGVEETPPLAEGLAQREQKVYKLWVEKEPQRILLGIAPEL